MGIIQKYYLENIIFKQFVDNKIVPLKISMNAVRWRMHASKERSVSIPAEVTPAIATLKTLVVYVMNANLIDITAILMQHALIMQKDSVVRAFLDGVTAVLPPLPEQTVNKMETFIPYQ